MLWAQWFLIVLYGLRLLLVLLLQGEKKTSVVDAFDLLAVMGGFALVAAAGGFTQILGWPQP